MANEKQIDPQVLGVLQQLFAGRFPSRNRNFQAHEAPHVRKAVRIYRYLQSVLRDLRNNPHDVVVTVVDGDPSGCYGVRIEFSELHGNRTAYLASYELELCTKDCPELALLLASPQDGPLTLPRPSAHHADD